MRRKRHAHAAKRGGRRYHIVAINGRTGRKVYMTSSPLLHHEAVTMLGKLMPAAKGVRKQLEEVT